MNISKSISFTRITSWLSGLSVLAALALHGGIASAEEVPAEVRIGYQKGTPILLLVKKQEALEARLKKIGINNVKWVEFQFGPPMLEALGAGAIDIGAVGDTPPVFAQAGGVNLVYFSATSPAEHAVLVPENSTIKTLADLKGKRIALGKGSSAHNVFIKTLAIAGLTLKDVEPVYLGPADATAAFNSAKVDAWVVWDPYFSIAQEHYNARVLLDTTDKRLASAGFYLAHADFAHKYPQTLTTIAQEIGVVTHWAGQHRSALAQIAAQATGIDVKSWEQSFARQSFNYGPLSDAQVDQQQKLADTFHSLGIIPKEIHIRDIVWNWTPVKK